MRLRGDERGQAIQIGFILIFGILIISFATYQAFVVPSQNKQVEFKHSQKVQGQLQDLRNAIVSSVSRSTTVAVAVDLGTTYPSRIIAANPPPPSGILQTVGSADPTVDLGVNNAVATRQEAADYWNGSRRTFTTGLVEYRPDYNEYRNGPVTVYDNTVLYNQFDESNRTITGQTMVDGDQITLVVLNGTLRVARPTSYSVDVRPVSTPTGATLVTPEAGETLSVTFTSRLPPEKWNETLSTEYDGATDDFEDRYVTDVSGTVRPDGRYDVTVTFEDATYQLRMVKVGVGTGVTGTSATYLTDVSGEGASVEQGASTQVTLSVRDGFGNPKADVTVNASASAGSFQDPDDTKSSNADGTVTFTYETTGSTPTGMQTLNFSLRRIGSGFDQSTTENVTVNVSVTSAGGGTTSAYTIAFDEPVIGGGEGITCSSGSCTYDFGDDKTDTSFTLTADTSPTVIGAEVDFALNTTDYGAYSSEGSTTDNSGEAQAVFGANDTGSITSYVVSGRSDDTLEVTLIDTSRLITAVEPNTDDDSKYEFIRLYFAAPTDTGGWDIDDTAGKVADLPDATLEETVYFAADGDAFAEKWGIDKSIVYNFSTAPKLNNPEDTISLVDSGGNVVDRVHYDDNNDDSTDDIVNNVDEKEVAYRVKTEGTLPYQDTNDNDADWKVEDESAFFDTVAVGGFESKTASDLLPSTSGQQQTLTFTPDTTIPSGTKVVINLTDAQQASPRQVDYLGSVKSVNVGSASLNKKTSEKAYVNWSSSSDLSGGTTVRIIVDQVKTGPESQQADPYDVDFTRKDSGSTVTTTFEVGRNTGGSELRALDISDLQQSASGQTQEIVFEPTTDLPAGQTVSIDLSDASGANRVDYTGASISDVNVSSNGVTFTDQTSDNTSVRFTSDGLSAGTAVKITISGIDANEGANAPYTIGFSRGDAGTSSTTFDVVNSPPSVTITRAEVTDSSGKTKHEVTVEFNASDPNGDITGYNVTMYDNSDYTTLVASKENTSYTGGSVSLLLQDDNNNEYDDPFYIRVKVSDEAGNVGEDQEDAT